MTIRYVIAVDILVADRDRVRICCMVHGVFKVFVGRRYAIVMAMEVISVLEVEWNFHQLS